MIPHAGMERCTCVAEDGRVGKAEREVGHAGQARAAVHLARDGSDERFPGRVEQSRERLGEVEVCTLGSSRTTIISTAVVHGQRIEYREQNRAYRFRSRCI
jgi:hypothetical protein